MYITLTRSLIGTGALVRRGRRIDYLQKNKKWNENIFEVVFELFDSYFLRRDMCFVIRNIKKLFHETAEV